MRNYNPAFTEGSKNLRTSSFKDHAASSMHVRAMSMFKKQRGDDVAEYAPIAKALLTMDESSQVTLKRKFDIAYFIAKEKLSFTKMKPLCDLQERYGVDLGARYKNDDACATFVTYIAKEQQHNLLETLSEVNFFQYTSIQGMLRMNSTQFSTSIPKRKMVRFTYAITFSL